MLKDLRTHIHRKNVIRDHHRILLAVSGGMDSMVMADLFIKSGYATGIAHCNFKLRGAAADRDEQMVASYAMLNKLFYASEAFDTEGHARERGISIQMAARDLRYHWMDQVRSDHGFDWIATAHHMDDVIETFFLNLVRGTGIKGMTGIPYVRDRIVRPLLFATREDIEAYARAHDIKYREDESNAGLKYKRNIIRHTIIPQFEELNPAFRSNFRDALDRFEGVRMVYDEAVQKYRNDLVHDDDGELVIQLGKLRLLPHGSALLYEFLSPLAIPAKMIRQIIDPGTRPAGRQFFTPTHRLVIDRDVLIVQPYREDDPVEFIISGPQGIIEEPLWLKWETIPRGTTKLPLKESATAHLDAALVEFPMVLRRWKEGDRFQPYGMTGQKKLSDFFTDLKLSLPEKESVWILTSRDQIIWVVGHRIDHRYRITRTTKKILRIETKELRN